MKCSLCGFKFTEKDAQTACKGCGIVKKCELIKCPNCGFEMPVEPGWIKRLRKKGKKDDTK